MVSQKIIVKNPTGLHLRPAGLFCKTAVDFKSRIKFVSKNGIGDAKSVLSVLAARVKMGDEIEIICEGEDEAQALVAMVKIIEEGLGE